jgi:hypothetical protein
MTLSEREVAAKLEIRDVLARYMKAIRVKDLDLMDACFTDDARIDYTAIGGSEKSWPDTRTWLEPMVLGMDLFWLYVGEVYTELRGDEADVETTWHGVFVAEAGATPLVVFGSYDDKFVRTGDGWRIRHRKDRPEIQVLSAGRE